MFQTALSFCPSLKNSQVLLQGPTSAFGESVSVSVGSGFRFFLALPKGLGFPGFCVSFLFLLGFYSGFTMFFFLFFFFFLRTSYEEISFSIIFLQTSYEEIFFSIKIAPPSNCLILAQQKGCKCVT